MSAHGDGQQQHQMQQPQAHPASSPDGSALNSPQSQQQQQPNAQSYGNGAEFFLANYRLGKTLGIGSFGKVSNTMSEEQAWAHLITPAGPSCH